LCRGLGVGLKAFATHWKLAGNQNVSVGQVGFVTRVLDVYLFKLLYQCGIFDRFRETFQSVILKLQVLFAEKL
jgi:hypothetical protein